MLLMTSCMKFRYGHQYLKVYKTKEKCCMLLININYQNVNKTFVRAKGYYVGVIIIFLMKTSKISPNLMKLFPLGYGVSPFVRQTCFDNTSSPEYHVTW